MQSYDPETGTYMVSGIVSFRGSARHRVWRPPTDVFETEDKFTVSVEIAGMDEADFSIGINQNILSIRGVRANTNERGAYHRMEILFGEFSVDVEIPGPIHVDSVTAEYRSGFLYVYLPKEKPVDIKINQ
jgi:HSP20 family molecular chaperone IbpA